MRRRARKTSSQPRGRESDGGVRRGLDHGWALAVTLFGITFGTIALVEGLTGGDGERSPGSYIGLVALFVGIAAWGGRLCWQALQLRASGPGLPAVPTEMGVQAFARGSGGRVTVLEAAANCDLTAEEAKCTLDRLAAEGSAAVRVTDDGILVYIFREQSKG